MIFIVIHISKKYNIRNLNCQESVVNYLTNNNRIIVDFERLKAIEHLRLLYSAPNLFVYQSPKYVKRMPLVTKNGRGILATKPLWKQAATNKKYLTYATYVYTNLGSNIGQIGNDLKDNYNTYVAPYKELDRQLTEIINTKK